MGAAVHVDTMEIGDMGAIGVLSNPSGAAIGVWAMAEKPKRKPVKKRKK